jgi:hypothetical protein
MMLYWMTTTKIEGEKRMNKQRIKTVKINESFSATLALVEKELKSNERIVETNVAGNHLVVIIESLDNKKLLLG